MKLLDIATNNRRASCDVCQNDMMIVNVCYDIGNWIILWKCDICGCEQETKEWGERVNHATK